MTSDHDLPQGLEFRAHTDATSMYVYTDERGNHLWIFKRSGVAGLTMEPSMDADTVQLTPAMLTWMAVTGNPQAAP